MADPEYYGIHPADHNDFLEMLRAWKSGEIVRRPSPRDRNIPGMRPTIRFVLLEDMPRGGSAEAAVTKRVATNEIQRVTFAGDVEGGTFKLTFSGSQTTALAADVTAAELRATLESLSTINSGDVAVEDFPAGWRVIFTGQFAGEDVPLMTAENSLGGAPNTIRIASEYDWLDAGRTERIHEVIPVEQPTPLIAGAVGVASWFPEIPGYGLHALECRDLSFADSYSY